MFPLHWLYICTWISMGISCCRTKNLLHVLGYYNLVFPCDSEEEDGFRVLPIASLVASSTSSKACLNLGSDCLCDVYLAELLFTLVCWTISEYWWDYGLGSNKEFLTLSKIIFALHQWVLVPTRNKWGCGFRDLKTTQCPTSNIFLLH